jgi:hypothetical protein
MLTLLLVPVTADVSSASSLVSAILTVLLEPVYSREFEWEANDFAYEVLLLSNLSVGF